MKKPRKIATMLGVLAAAAGLSVSAWTVATVAMRSARASELVGRADELLGGRSAEGEIDCAAAVALLRQAAEVDPGNARARQSLHLAEGCASVQRGDLVLAQPELRTAAAVLPTDPRPHCWIGEVELDSGRPDMARASFEQALALDRGHAPALLGLADALIDLGEEQAALDLLERPTIERTAHVETRRGLLLELLGRPEEARAAYERAIELAPTAFEARNNLAALLRQTGDLDAAWQAIGVALEQHPDEPLVLRNAGLIAIALGRDERAAELLQRAAELDSSSPDPLRALGDHYLATGRAREASEILGRATERFPTDAPLLNSLGNSLAALGDLEAARDVYRRAIVADGRLAHPHNGLAALMLAEGDLSGAERELNEAARIDPGDVQVRRNLAELGRRRESGAHGTSQDAPAARHL